MSEEPPAPAPVKPPHKRRGCKPGQNNGNGSRSDFDAPVNVEAYKQIAVEAIVGKPILAIATDHGLPREQVNRVGKICGMAIEEFVEEARLKSQQVLDIIHGKMLDAAPTLKGLQPFLAHGIVMDKYRDLTGRATPTAIHQTNIQINGLDRSSAMSLLSGNGSGIAANTIQTNEPRNVSRAHNGFPEHSGPSQHATHSAMHPGSITTPDNAASNDTTSDNTTD